VSFEGSDLRKSTSPHTRIQTCARTHSQHGCVDDRMQLFNSVYMQMCTVWNALCMCVRARARVCACICVCDCLFACPRMYVYLCMKVWLVHATTTTHGCLTSAAHNACSRFILSRSSSVLLILTDELFFSRSLVDCSSSSSCMSMAICFSLSWKRVVVSASSSLNARSARSCTKR